MIQWKDSNHLEINGMPAFAMSDDSPMNIVNKYSDRLFIQKTKEMLLFYEKLNKNHEIKNVFEIGLFKGGSAPYFQAAYQAKKIVSMDINEEPLKILDYYRNEKFLTDQIITYLGVDQSDQKKVKTILKTEFISGELDLVIDDASHFLRETKACFNVCFPWLRPGGRYVIEDWRWANWMPETPVRGGKIRDDLIRKVFEKQPPLSLLGLQLAMICGARSDVISKVEFDFHFITVTRGTAPLDVENFDLRNYYDMLQTDCIAEQDKLW